MNLLTANIWSNDSGLCPYEIVTALCICSQFTHIFSQRLAHKKNSIELVMLFTVAYNKNKNLHTVYQISKQINL